MPNPKPKPLHSDKRKKKHRVSERKQLVDSLDNIVSKIVILRDGGCVTPGGCWGALNSSHFYKRENWGIRWSLENCNCQCFGHNGAHRYHEFKYTQYMRQHYGNDILSKLWAEEEAYRARPQKWTVPELRDLLATLTKQYEGMCANREIGL